MSKPALPPEEHAKLVMEQVYQIPQWERIETASLARIINKSCSTVGNAFRTLGIERDYSIIKKTTRGLYLTAKEVEPNDGVSCVQCKGRPQCANCYSIELLGRPLLKETACYSNFSSLL